MVFRWFRQNKQATKWLYIGVTIFVMVTFTVTGAMLDGLSDDSGKRVAGRFVTKGGETIEVTAIDFRNRSQRLNRMAGGRIEEEGVWQVIMLDALADEAGIVVGDEMRNRYIRAALSSIETKAQYQQFLKRAQLSEAEFQEMMRDDARRNLYQQLAENPPRVLSEAIYERFKTDNEQFLIDYVAFSDDAIESGLDASSVSEDELKSFYEDDMNPVRKANDFSFPERYGLDAAVLDLAAADTATMAAMLPESQREIQDEEIQSFYDANLDRYLIEDESEEDESEEDESAEDESAEDETDEDETDEDEDDFESYRELADVRAEIEKELIATRLINAAVGEYNNLKFERDRKKAADAAKPAEPDANGEDEGGETEEGDEASADEDLLALVAAKFGLEIVDFGEPMLLEAIKGLDRIGGADLESVRFLPEGGVRARHMNEDVRFGAVVRMKAKVAAEPKPFADIKDQLPEVWREETARKRAEEGAKAFWDALTAKARESVTDEVAKLEQEANDLADAMIEKDSVEDDAKKQEIRDRELAAVKPRIEAAIAPHRGEHFASVAAEQGLTVEQVDWFSKGYRSTGFYRDDAASPAKFLKGHTPLFATSIGGVVGPLRDGASSASLVARVADRRFPAPSEMTLSDRTNAENQVRQEVDPDFFMRRYYGRSNSFDFEKLSRELRLERFEERREGDDEEEEEATPSN